MFVGTRTIAVGDGDASVEVRLCYPTLRAPTLEKFGPYEIEVAVDAPLEGVGHPHVVISHGSMGSPWSHRGLAAHLAAAGWVVAMPQHPGDNRTDHKLFGTPANLESRPRFVRRVIDALGVDRVAVIGHSMGGYTALAVAGGRPLALPHETADGRAQPVPVERDPRVHALVLLAPATPWFMADGALAEVDVPILLRTGELDTQAPASFADIVVRGVRGPIDHRVIANAGHFAFQTPFPPALTSPKFPPSQDPPGFDRPAFQPLLHAEIEAFLTCS